MSQRIQFDGRECVVISPEDYDAYKSLQSQLAALEAELARYEGAEVVVWMEPNFGDDFSVVPRDGWTACIAKPTKGEAP